MKPRIAACCAALLCGLGLTPTQAAILSIGPTAASASVGSLLGMTLRISDITDQGAPSLGSFDVDIRFDPAILAYSGTVFGDPILGKQLDLQGLGSLSSAVPSTGRVNLFELSLDTPAELNTLQAGSFTLATITFGVVGAGTGLVEIVPNALGDALGDPLAVAVEGATITANVAPVPLPPPALLLGSGLFAAIAWARRLSARPADAETSLPAPAAHE